MNNLTLDDILKSKIYVKQNAAVQFQSPAAYIEPFLESVKDINGLTYTVDVSGTIANKNADDNQLNEAYPRVKIEAVLPKEYDVDDHSAVIGLVYGLDTQKPVMKIYSGHNAWACTNLSVFRATNLHQVELLQGITSIYERAKYFTEDVVDNTTAFVRRLNEMKETQYVGNDIDRVIGALLRKGIQQKTIGITHITAAAQSLYDKNSVYGIKNNETSQWNIYSALTQYITDKIDVVDKCSKTLACSSLFENLNYK